MLPEDALYGLYLPTNGSTVTFLSIFPATFPDAHGANLVITRIFIIPTGNDKKKFPACCMHMHLDRDT